MPGRPAAADAGAPYTLQAQALKVTAGGTSLVGGSSTAAAGRNQPATATGDGIDIELATAGPAGPAGRRAQRDDRAHR